MNRFVLLAAAALATFATATPAAAALLLGKTVQISYEFPAVGSVYEGPNAVLVNGTNSTTFFGLVKATPGDTSLSITFPDGAATFTSTGFNGVHLFDGNNSIAAFTAATVGSLNNFAFDASRISFDADNIYLNFQGLSFDNSSNLTVNIASVPEPTSWALMIGGFGMVGAAMRRRKGFVAA